MIKYCPKCGSSMPIYAKIDRPHMGAIGVFRCTLCSKEHRELLPLDEPDMTEFTIPECHKENDNE